MTKMIPLLRCKILIFQHNGTPCIKVQARIFITNILRFSIILFSFSSNCIVRTTTLIKSSETLRARNMPLFVKIIFWKKNSYSVFLCVLLCSDTLLFTGIVLMPREESFSIFLSHIF